MVAQIKGVVRQMLKDILSVASLPVLILVVVGAVAWHYVEPAPPKHLVISTGSDESAYQDYAERYREILARDGVTLELRPSSGAVENLRRLTDDDSDVDVGFVQGGMLSDVNELPDLESLGSLYYEPVWLFYRAKREHVRIADLKGSRIAIGREGGGTQSLALKLLHASGVSSRNSRIVTLGGDDAAQALLRGEVDAAIFLVAAESPIVTRLGTAPRIRLMDLDHAEAYTRVLPFLHHLVLPRGVISLEKDIPGRDIDMLAVTATLVVRDDLHPALEHLLLRAMKEVHSTPGVLWQEHEFPADRDVDLPIAASAERYYKSGSPYLYRVLPFWLASLVERLSVLIIPLLAVAIPFSRVVPALYSWRVRSKVYRWYGELEFLEVQIRDAKDGDPAACRKALEQLDSIEQCVNRIRLPVAFANHLYILREHIDLVRRNLAAKLQSGS